MSAAETVRKYMDDNGIRLSFLSQRTGIKYELLRRSLEGTRALNADELLLIIDVLRLDLDVFRDTA